MSVVAIIPARYASTRFPGKPLARETGKYLIQHVYERVCAARRIQRCIVATDDRRILDAVREFDGEAVMTSDAHPSGTDRIAEAARGLGSGPEDIIVNVQGDEPEMAPDDLDALVARLEREPDCPAATLACPFPADGDPADANAVKVVTDLAGRALFFSRSLIPYPRDRQAESAATCAMWLLHLGVYAYRRDFLLEFASWEPSPLETSEKLEQLRILEHGFPIAVERVNRSAVGIDTPEDYRRFVLRYGDVDRDGAR